MHVERRLVRLYDHKAGDFVNVTVQVEVDITALAEQFAMKARRNKSRKAKIAHGAITIVHKEG